ncbi:hypothetical protein Tco_1380966 [Tanacetum coccineum]
MQLAIVVLVTALASAFVFRFAPLESSLSQLVLLSAPLGLHLVSVLVHVESDVVHLESDLHHSRPTNTFSKYYTNDDWTDIMGQVHANQGLTSDLLGPDVKLIAKRRRAFAAQRFQEKRNKPMTYAQQKAYMRTFVKNQSTTIYTTGWTMKHVKSLSDEQLQSEFEKIRTTVADLQSQKLRRTLKRAGEDLEHDVSKKPLLILGKFFIWLIDKIC